MVDKLYEEMNIPAECNVGNTIFKKLFYENGTMSTTDKEMFTDDIEKIIWKYSFKEENLNIKSFKNEELEYEEIALIEVSLSKESKYKKICEIIQKTIPYPLIIVLTHDEKVLINTAYKRINKVDESKSTIDDFIYINWICMNNLKDNEVSFLNSIDIKKFSFVNMYKFYCSFVEKLNLLNASSITGNFEVLINKDIQEVNELNSQIEKINSEIEKLKIDINKEQHFNKKIDINIKIKKLELKKNRVIEKLNS
ncbi:MAG: DUF4391 domain-containing protein [Clostridium sp.]|uniref:DUF4391 domain-containing protein n=1 Tax=Clostridium sp. TaxID=1506 RepID=UPI0025C126A6|nr:DUF4391 domain-containing protein [Clostridium sp.]MCE5219854.1 DUF4391 domain-containing protein [Clostridium sp.]